MPALYYILVLIVAIAAATATAVAESIVRGAVDARQFVAYIIAYTLVILLPPAIAKWLKKE